MSNVYWLTDAPMERLKPFFPKSHCRPYGNDLRVLIGVIFISRNGLRGCDAPKEFGPAKTLDNRWKRWSDSGIVARIMIDVTYLKAHRTASSLRVKTGYERGTVLSVGSRKPTEWVA